MHHLFKKTYVLILLVGLALLSTIVQAQCIQGDCENGQGVKWYADSSRFEGQFENGQKKCGTYTYRDGSVYKGCFEKNRRTGYGVYTYANGESFSGSFVDDKKFYGEYRSANGDVYTGTFLNNKPDGYGTLQLANGRFWEGQWENGQRVWGGLVNQVNDSVMVMEPFDTAVVESAGKNQKASSAPRFFAVVVGIADYEGSQYDLTYSDNDAIQFYAQLKAALPNEMAAGKSVLLLNNKATVQNITQALQETFSMATENDFILFYFSGHGSNGSFCPYNILGSQLSHNTVKAYFKNAKAKYRVCIADACFSGSIEQANRQNYGASSASLRDARLAVIMSSQSNQTSLEIPRLKQSVFSYYLLSGLRGAADLNRDQYITMGELFVYTKRAVSSYTRNDQIPIIFGKDLERIPLSRIK